MKVTLEESKARQLDHKKRCEALVQQGVVVSLVDNEKMSYEKLYNAIPFVKNKQVKVLDIGCQTGAAYTRVLHELDYYGIEILEEVADMARAGGIPNVTTGFMEELDKHYEPKMFDVVWARHILEHSADFQIVCNQIKKVLKSGGVLAFIVPCGFHNEPAHITEFEMEGWKQAFKDNGFKIEVDWQHDFNLNEYCGIAKVV